MSTRRAKSTEPLSSAQLIDLNDLPLGVIDVELSTAPAELVSDTKVIVLHHEQGAPAGVLKVARGVLGPAELRIQRRVLAELAVHHRLDDEWRELVPRILAFNERTDVTTSVESYRPGTDLAAVLARRSNNAAALTTSALAAIAPLHRRTATYVGMDNICYLRRWVIEPLADVTYMCQRLDPRL